MGVTVAPVSGFPVAQPSGNPGVGLAFVAFELLSVGSRLLPFQLQHEKAELEQHLEQEQEFQVNKLMKKIKKLENDTISKQLTLEQVSPAHCLGFPFQPPVAGTEGQRGETPFSLPFHGGDCAFQVSVGELTVSRSSAHMLSRFHHGVFHELWGELLLYSGERQVPVL